MAEITRKVTLLSHTQLAQSIVEEILESDLKPLFFDEDNVWSNEVTDGQALALTAIRTCYSANKPSEIVAKEGARYFKAKASDGGTGTDADRLIRMIVSSGHTSTLEGITFNFAVEGVSRALLAQLTRHRVGFSFSVQSQRYVRMGSSDRSGGFDYVVPDTIKAKHSVNEHGDYDDENAYEYFAKAMRDIQDVYDTLRSHGIPAEDARAVLPQAASCNIVLSANLRAILDFYGKRKAGNGAQAEIAGLAEDLRKAVVNVEPWIDAFFGVNEMEASE